MRSLITLLGRTIVPVFVATLLVAASGLAPAAHAQVTVFAQDLAGFDAAAGTPPISLDFDSVSPNTDITGNTIAGITLFGTGAPLIVVVGSDTVTPDGFADVIDPATNQLLPTSGRNVLSPGGLILGPGSNPGVEADNLTIVFTNAVSSFGFDHLSQSADGFSFTSISVFDVSDTLLYSGGVPISNVNNIGGGAPGGADFWGIVSQSANIKRIVIVEGDSDSQFPDANIGYDTFRYNIVASAAPEASLFALLALGGLALGVVAVRRRVAAH